MACAAMPISLLSSLSTDVRDIDGSRRDSVVQQIVEVAERVAAKRKVQHAFGRLSAGELHIPVFRFMRSCNHLLV
jgi:hypothetical protein